MYDNKPINLCACGKEKKVMSKYCLKCGSEINILRGRLSNTINKEKRAVIENTLKDILIFHGTYEDPIKTKTTKMREKREKEKEL